MRNAMVFLLATTVAASGCHRSLRYSADDQPAASWAGPAPRLVGPVNWPIGAAPPPRAYLIRGQDYASDWADLSGSMRDQLARAGMKPLQTPPPRTVEEARKTLAAAAKAGGQLAYVRMQVWSCGERFKTWVGFMFVIGLAPGLICMALPVNDEFALIQLDAIVVDPGSQEVLGTYLVNEGYNGSGTGYALNAAPEARAMTQDAIRKLVDEISADARAKYPRRKKVDDLAAALVGPPVIPALTPAAKAKLAKTQPKLSKPSAPPPGTPGAKVAWLEHYGEVQAGVTTRAQVDALLGTPTLNQLDKKTNRQMYFFVHSQPEAGKIVTRMFYVWFKTGTDVVDEVKYSQTGS